MTKPDATSLYITEAESVERIYAATIDVTCDYPLVSDESGELVRDDEAIRDGIRDWLRVANQPKYADHPALANVPRPVGGAKRQRYALRRYRAAEIDEHALWLRESCVTGLSRMG